jgi:hypothetical protein
LHCTAANVRFVPISLQKSAMTVAGWREILELVGFQ